MNHDWEKIRQKIEQRILESNDLQKLSQLRIELLGKKGYINTFMQEMKELSSEQRKEFGMMVNSLKHEVESKLTEKIAEVKERELLQQVEREKIDITLPGDKVVYGTLHPLTVVQQQIEDIFVSMGYAVVEGPELEFDVYNFEKANIPADHPSRDMQDTLYVDAERLLRTQTTAIQMRVLEKEGSNLPIKVICPGKVYRRDDDDATHSHQFTQIEALVLGEGIKLSDLKGTLELLARSMFGPEREIRLRQSYFPFTEPSQEIDVSCHMCNGQGCPVCKGTGWIEILGSGMVHPNVLEKAGIDSAKYSGFALGVGVERVAMLKYGIDDIRNFYGNNVNFLRTFKRFE